MMTVDQVVDALKPFFGVTLSKELSGEKWNQYGLALRDVNPGDLDDAIADLRKSHGFRNAPLPAEIYKRCEAHRKRRTVLEQPVERFVKADPSDGEWKTFTIKGLGSARMHVLPDHHPALKRSACTRCLDTGWEHLPDENPGKQPTYQRCGCIPRNPVLQQTRTRNAEHAKKRT